MTGLGTVTASVWFEREPQPDDVLEAGLVELSSSGRTQECGDMALRRKLARHAGRFWKIDSWQTQVMPLPTTLARRVDIGRRTPDVVAEGCAHVMPEPSSALGRLVARVWRRALRAYVAETSAPRDLDAFEHLPASFADAHAAQSWGELERGVRAHYAHEHGLSMREVTAFEACAPFLRELTDVIVHHRSAHIVFDRLEDVEVRMAGVHAVSLALQLLAAVSLAPDTVLLEGWGPGTSRIAWPRAVPLTSVRRLS
ncbi:MAG: hypothetical protein RMA76_21835 [Deltaproteobacteria bacterium]|jgi:hypothetical protein